MERPIDTPKAETLEELGTMIGQLRTDALVVVLRALWKELFRQKKEHEEEKKFKYVRYGGLALEYLNHTITFLISMLVLRRQYSPDDFKDQPPLILTDSV